MSTILKEYLKNRICKRKNIWKIEYVKERIFEKYRSHAIFFRKLHDQRGFSFLSDYGTKSEKDDESKKKYLVDSTANDWGVTLQVTGAITILPFVFYFDVMIMNDNYVDDN